MLFLPQFVVIVAFPSMATGSERRRALVVSLSLVAGPRRRRHPRRRGCCRASRSASSAARSTAEVEPRLWVFAILGTLLSMIQLLVYSVLARQGTRSVYVVWLALLVPDRRRARRPTRCSASSPSSCWSTSSLLVVLLGISAWFLREGAPAAEEPATAASEPTAGDGPRRTTLSARRRASCGRCRRTRRAARPGPRPDPSARAPGSASASLSPGATSRTSSSWTCSSIRDDRPCSAMADSTPSIATLIRSAAEPWMGALSAIRSAVSRRMPVVAGQVGQVAAATHDRLGEAGARAPRRRCRRGSRGCRRTSRSTRPSDPRASPG